MFDLFEFRYLAPVNQVLAKLPLFKSYYAKRTVGIWIIVLSAIIPAVGILTFFRPSEFLIVYASALILIFAPVLCGIVVWLSQTKKSLMGPLAQASVIELYTNHSGVMFASRVSVVAQAYDHQGCPPDAYSWDIAWANIASAQISRRDSSVCLWCTYTYKVYQGFAQERVRSSYTRSGPIVIPLGFQDEGRFMQQLQSKVADVSFVDSLDPTNMVAMLHI